MHCRVMILLSALSASGLAQPARLYGEGVPESGRIRCQTKDYTVSFDASRAWTIYDMAFQDKTFSLSNGFYGTVLTPKGGKWWGTGHGEGGKEVVHALKLTVDGEEQPVTIDKAYSGKRISLLKDSTIWKFKAHAEVTLAEEYVLERIQLEALEDCELSILYCFMHCFPPTTTTWVAELPDGKLENGTLGHNEGFQVQKDTRWVSQFDPTLGLGLFCYTPRVIAGERSMSKIWDLRRYHKYYLQQTRGQAYKAGEKLDFTVVVRALPNESGDWEASRAAAAELKKIFPPVPVE